MSFCKNGEKEEMPTRLVMRGGGKRIVLLKNREMGGFDFVSISVFYEAFFFQGKRGLYILVRFAAFSAAGGAANLIDIVVSPSFRFLFQSGC